ncbi:MAG TPA: hypothetical protein VII40_03555 [Xanthobacteraceae bacterium]
MSEDPKSDASNSEILARQRHEFMDLMGGRATLIINICLLCMICIATAEDQYITKTVLGQYGSSHIWIMFVPAAVVFVIHRKLFSFFFSLIIIWYLTVLTYQIWLMRNGPPWSFAQKNLGDAETVVFIFSLICLLLYLIGLGIIKSINAIAPDRGEGR